MTSSDGCSYPHGLLQTVTFQFLVFVGWFLSMAAIGDCKFVTISTGNLINDDEVANLVPGDRGAGFVIFEKLNGNCFYDLGGDLLDLYVDDFLGSDWRAARALGATAAILAFVMFIWSLMFICVPHPKILRYVVASFLLIITLFQGLTFMVLGSGFCDTYDCKFSRSAGLSVGALLCFFICAVAVCMMRDEEKYDEEPVVASDPYGDTAEKEEPMEQDVAEEDKLSSEEDAADELDEAMGDTEEGAAEVAQDEPKEKKKWWKFGKK